MVAPNNSGLTSLVPPVVTPLQGLARFGGVTQGSARCSLRPGLAFVGPLAVKTEFA